MTVTYQHHMSDTHQDHTLELPWNMDTALCCTALCTDSLETGSDLQATPTSHNTTADTGSFLTCKPRPLLTIQQLILGHFWPASHAHFSQYNSWYWVISLFWLVLHSAEPLSETAVTHRPQGVIIVGIYMSSNIYYLLLLYLIRKVLCRRLSTIFSWNFRS